MEEYQDKGKVNLLNSKLDFNKPFKTSLSVINKNCNVKPGQPGLDTVQTRACGPITEKKTVGDGTSTKMKTELNMPPNKCTRMDDPMSSNIPFDPTTSSTPTKQCDRSNNQMTQTKRRVKFNTDR